MNAWVFVTGSSKRLGREIAVHLAKKGYHLIIHYHTSEQEAEHTAQLCRIHGVEARLIQGSFSTRLSTDEFIERYLQQFSHTAHIIHNVSYMQPGNLSSLGYEAWLHSFQVNAHAPLAITQALLPFVVKEKGCIVHIGTAGLGRCKAYTYAPAYHLSKTLLWNMTQSLAKELMDKGVRVNMVSPGILENSLIFPPNKKEIESLNRWGNLSEVARAVCFLVDPESSYITGQNMDISGGFGL